jgi:hypothetical protein
VFPRLTSIGATFDGDGATVKMHLRAGPRQRSEPASIGMFKSNRRLLRRFTQGSRFSGPAVQP